MPSRLTNAWSVTGSCAPEPRVPAGECRHRADRRVDKHPLLAVRHEAKPNAGRAAKFDHTFGGAGGPAVALERFAQTILSGRRPTISMSGRPSA